MRVLTASVVLQTAMAAEARLAEVLTF